MTSYQRLNAMAKQVRVSSDPIEKRKFENAVGDEVSKLLRESSRIESELKSLELLKRLASTPPARLNGKLEPPEGYEVVAVFDCDEVGVYYENEDMDMIEVPWPFAADYVFPHDCELLGIRVE